jgi:hypothetical protein
MENTVLTGSSDGLVRAVQVLPTRLVGVVADHGELPIERLAVGGGIGRLSLEEGNNDEKEGGKVGKGKGKGKAESDDEDDENSDAKEGAGTGAGRWWVASAGHDEVLRLTDLEAFFRDPSTGEEQEDASEDSEMGGDRGESEDADEVAEGKVGNADVEEKQDSEADSDGEDSDAPTAKKRKRKPEKDPLVVRRKKGKNEVDVDDGAFFDGL